MIQAKSSVDQSVSDDDLLRPAQAGDLPAYERLVLRYERPVFHFAYLVLRDTQAATAAAWRTFVDAFKGLKGLGSSSALLTLLLRGTLGQLRQGQGRLRQSPTSRPFDSTLPLLLPPEVAVVFGEQNRMVLGMVTALSFEDQVVLYLHYFLELGFSQVGEVLETSEATARMSLAAALEHLLGGLSQHPGAGGQASR